MSVPILLLTGLLTALDPSPTQPPAPHYHTGRPFISPMGEPFPVRAPGDDPLADWFGQAERYHDGLLTLDEMQLDADRFFAALDTNHDAEIDPDETEHYENVIAPQVRTSFDGYAGGTEDGSPAGEGDRHPGHGGGHHVGGGHWRAPRGGEGEQQGAARFGLLDLPEPVIAADTDFSRGISLDEFRKAAQLRFQALDVDRRGLLTLAVLETLRPAAPVRPKRDPDAPSGLDANTDTGG
ncbi:MAG TPA: EF-hand domain-containing protein [Sphingomicrobium sp.]|nr:EF-hand domain-containing protein [Sphingomicrobium sp.]